MKIYYEIEERKYSSNCIVRIEESIAKNGKPEYKRERVLAPFRKKILGDKLVQQLLELLNNGTLTM